MKIALSKALQQFAQPKPMEEAIPYSFYHYQELAAGALSALLTFFNVAAGQLDSGGNAVTQEDTNMDVASQLTDPYRFLCTRICVPILLGSTNVSPVSSSALATAEVDDVAQLAKRGFFRFIILSKDYLKLSPLGQLPGGYGLWGSVSAASGSNAVNITNAIANNGMPLVDQGYKTMLAIPSKATFQVQISFPKSTVTTSNIIRLGVVLHGVLFRPEQ